MRHSPFSRGFLWGLTAIVFAPAQAEPGSASRLVGASLLVDVVDFSVGKPAILAGGDANQTNQTDQLASKIALKEKELHDEKLRIDAALSTVAKANSTLKAKEKEMDSIRAQLAADAANAQTLQKEVAAARARLEALQSTDDHKVGPVAVWLTELPHQQGIALIIGIVGLLCIIGPTDITRGLLAISGSCVGALMLAGCVTSFATGPSCFGSMRILLEGNGHLLGYSVWAVMFALGIVRWFLGFNCALYACVDEVELDGAGRVIRSGASLQKPLLGDEVVGRIRPARA